MDELHDGRRLPTDELPKCFTCDGLGNILVLNEHGFPEDTTTCPDCNGVGYVQPEDEEIPY